MNHLTRLRYDAGLTVEQLAEQSGVKAATIYAIESGRSRRPRVQTAQPLAQVLGVAVSELIRVDKLPEAA